MKRSEINAIMHRADDFLRQQNFHLPPFAYWTPEDWRHTGPEAREIVQNKLGWDITDFGKGDFPHLGLFLFTIRNGNPENWKSLRGKLYAEKVMLVEEKQVTPYPLPLVQNGRHHQPRRRQAAHPALQFHTCRDPGRTGRSAGLR